MIKKNSIFVTVAFSLAFVAFTTNVGFAWDVSDLNASVIRADFKKTVAKLSKKIQTQAKVEIPQVPQVSCEYEVPKSEKYSAQVIEVRTKLRVETEEEFKVKVFMENTGNTPWFSAKSNCSGPIVNLGTDSERDHESVFYSPKANGGDSNWVGANRVGLDQLRVDPGAVASFTFRVKAGEDPDVYKEYMTPVVEGVTWIDGAGVSFTVMIGDTGEDTAVINKKMLFAGESGSVMELDLDAEKRIAVDLSEQKMTVYLGDHLVREFYVSTGAAKTPTPPGNYSISLKQEVRVGGKAPHYVMPKFMMFKAGGYGIHALPSLSRKGGDLFWTEARSHIGRPVSHGCIRVLPEDADFVYQYADIGTKVVVQR
ncbi:MAG: L,D-transpeptidase [Candidatus Gracilibacteria bacterium]